MKTSMIKHVAMASCWNVHFQRSDVAAVVACSDCAWGVVCFSFMYLVTESVTSPRTRIEVCMLPYVFYRVTR